MAGDKGLEKLTRALVVGVSIGSVPLVTVGCAQFGSTGIASLDFSNAYAAQSAELCSKALKSKLAGDVDAVMTAFPGGSCIIPLLRALPPKTLVALSPGALKGLTPGIKRQIPKSVAVYLPVDLGTARVAYQGDDDSPIGSY